MRTLTQAQVVAVQEAIYADMSAYLGYDIVVQEVSGAAGDRVKFSLLGLTDEDRDSDVVKQEFLKSYERAYRLATMQRNN